jgi:choline dehydrogenase-like flavoprotein
MARTVFDVCVVGSGPGGGIASYVLARAGAKVALVEAGPALRAGVDYGTHPRVWEVRNERLRAGFRSLTPNLFADRRERDHFIPVGDRPDHGWLKALGGRSLCWAGHSLRFGPLDFRRWPVSYDEVAPYYSRAERFMGVYGYLDGLLNLPDGEFLRPVPMRCGEMLLRRGVERLKAKGRKLEFIAQRKAMATEAHDSKRSLCHYCGQCGGCCVDSKYTSANTPIPMARATGNLTLYTEAMMTRIVVDRSGRRVAGIEFTRPDGTVELVTCRALVLACGAVETARQLLVNSTREFPAGLANSSGQVGRNLTSHFGLTVIGFFPELAARDASNDDGTGYYHGLLTGLHWDRPHPDFDGTYQVQCGSGLGGGQLMVRNVPGFGAALKRELRARNAGHAGMNMQGSLFISPQKFVDLDPARTDRYGLRLSRVHLHYESNDVAMARDMVATCEEVIRTAGGEVASTPGTVAAAQLQIDYNHWVGTARMGTDPRSSVVNTSGQCHDVPNLFIGDAAVFAANPEKNPTLTNIALSWRTSEHLIEKLRRGELA